MHLLQTWIHVKISTTLTAASDPTVQAPRFDTRGQHSIEKRGDGFLCAHFVSICAH